MSHLTKDNAKSLTELVPVLSVIFLGVSVSSIIIYYSIFGFQPFQFYSLSDLVPNLLNNLGSLFFLSMFGLFVNLILYIIRWMNGYTSKLTNKKLKNTIVAVQVVIFSLLTIYFFWNVTAYNSFFFNNNLSFFNDIVKVFFLTYFIALFFTIQNKVVQLYLKLTFNDFIKVLIPFILYFPLNSIANAYAIQSNSGNRNISLIKNDNSVLSPYDTEKYIIGTTGELYFLFNVKSRSTYIIKKSEVKTEIIYPKLDYYVKEDYLTRTHPKTVRR